MQNYPRERVYRFWRWQKLCIRYLIIWFLRMTELFQRRADNEYSKYPSKICFLWQFWQPNTKTEYFKESLSYSVSAIWNSIPQEIKRDWLRLFCFAFLLYVCVFVILGYKSWKENNIGHFDDSLRIRICKLSTECNGMAAAIVALSEGFYCIPPRKPTLTKS